MNRERYEISKSQAKDAIQWRLKNETFESCDRFFYEPPTGVGCTGGCGSIFGYKGENCLFFVIGTIPKNQLEAGL